MPTVVKEDLLALYVEMLKRTLLGGFSDPVEVTLVEPQSGLKCAIAQLVAKTGFRLARVRNVDREQREQGRDWPLYAYSMIGRARLDNLQFCVEDVLSRGVPGDLIETGVWKGGATIFMRGLLKAHGSMDRAVWVADSFQGLPRPEAAKYASDAGSRLHQARELAISLEQVEENFRTFGLLDDQVRFLKGWFRDTLPDAPIQKLAVMRLDGDLYESTMDGLTSLYDKLSVGGYVIIDDYGALESCSKAVHDFRESRGIRDPLEMIDWSGAFWRRSR
jgi:O-methyltransferase